ncbi:FliI/YscN family ATPase [Sulfitobacter geojensis]|uniref:FliI/YscN family ATPase n=1 Tax=Sulfitobacter geojensis TaxID=1342299 RepID=UPI0007DA436D|nr:FliI/YscN family ATPase [Sulfitobacter geojensis]OAN97720.1 flagellar protein export ATPase FliI [Sulfitobacter geojensis]
MKTFAKMQDAIYSSSSARTIGSTKAIVGLTLTVGGLEAVAGIGSRCRVFGRKGIVDGQVVGAQEGDLCVLPFGAWDGVAVGDPVELIELDDMVYPDESWIGTVVDALGRPLSDYDRAPRPRKKTTGAAQPPKAFERKQVGEKLETQIKCVDVFTPLCRGQRMGVFAGSGVGKSTLMAMLARNTDADVIVIGLIGERGREVQQFIREDLGPEGMARAVVVVSTGDEAPLLRKQAALTTTAIAEYFKSQGKQVLLLLDSVTRFAMAQREIGLARGEPPTLRGYPPSVFSELPHLLERTGPGREGEGDITALYTVLVDGDDMNEPIADAVRGIVDGHLVLDRRIAEQGRFPAIDLQKSLSRMLPGCHSPEEFEITRTARKALGRYADMEDLIRLGAYKPGSDVDTDQAVLLFQKVSPFLSQQRSECSAAGQSFAEIYRMILEAGIDDPLAAFFEQQDVQAGAVPAHAQ